MESFVILLWNDMKRLSHFVILEVPCNKIGVSFFYLDIYVYSDLSQYLLINNNLLNFTFLDIYPIYFRLYKTSRCRSIIVNNIY